MSPERFHEITACYPKLRVAIIGDFCLDRYLEIDPAREEISIETGLPVYNVTNVRAQPGAAGTILNNLVALGVGEIIPVGFCGDDGEGYELRRALSSLKGVRLDHYFSTSLRRTFTYCKPLVLQPGELPQELNRLDSKNWTSTPSEVVERTLRSITDLRSTVDAVIVMDQVDQPDTGVVTAQVRAALTTFSEEIPVIADSRRGLRDYPPVIFKMNGVELSALMERNDAATQESVWETAAELAARNGRPVFITMAEKGIIGAEPAGQVQHVEALPLRGPIDIVGAGDSVTANLALALAANATLRESLELAMLASSIVIHQLGTTGTASVAQMAALQSC